MKRLIPLLLIAALLAGCGAAETPAPTEATEAPAAQSTPLSAPDTNETDFVSRFSEETLITLSDSGLDVSGPNSMNVFASGDIVYYEEKTAYESGNPYGEGTEADMHTAEEAAAHTVVNITAPGTYRVTGTLSAGQLRIDLGDDAYEDPNAVVELILENADITCTVAPAILFLNVYECDGEWDTDNARPDVDTTAAGANLILQGENKVSGSYVARIYKDKEGEKKLWKQDGAIYSYMSMNVFGPGSLDLTAENEGLDTELHLTVNGGQINIRSGNDGINTNEDGVSVTTINGGRLHIIAGLGEEGDGIDSNGYLVINGGTVVSAANPAADAGLDSDLGSFIHGGTVIALGSAMDWAESNSGQVTMNLQFASFQTGGITVTREDGTVIFAYDPNADEILGENARRYQGAILSCANFTQGESYHVYVGSALTGSQTGGVYDVTTVTAHSGGTQMAYTGTDVMTRPGGMDGGMGGGMDGFGGQRPEDGGGRDEIPEGEMPSMPEDFTMPDGEIPSMPEGEMPQGGFGGGNRGQGSGGEIPEGEMPSMPEDFTMPEGEIPTMPEGQEPPELSGGQMGGNFPGMGGQTGGEANTSFYMQDQVNFFSGLTAVQ